MCVVVRGFFGAACHLLSLLLQWYMTPLDHAEMNGHSDTAAVLLADPRFVAAVDAAALAAMRATAEARTKWRPYV